MTDLMNNLSPETKETIKTIVQGLKNLKDRKGEIMELYKRNLFDPMTEIVSKYKDAFQGLHIPEGLYKKI